MCSPAKTMRTRISVMFIVSLLLPSKSTARNNVDLIRFYTAVSHKY